MTGINGPTNDMWRVDVSGYPVSVRGRPAKEHLERVNYQLARMKMALHRISKIFPPGIDDDAGAGSVAREALSDV